MNKSKYNKSNFKKVVSKIPSGFMKQQLASKVSHKNRMRSAKLALSVLAILDHKKMSQASLAKKMGVSPQQVSKVLKGQSNFTFETINKLEKALGYSLLEVRTIDFEREERKIKFVMKEMEERTIVVKSTKQMAASSLVVKENFSHSQKVSYNSYNSLEVADNNLRPTG